MEPQAQGIAGRHKRRREPEFLRVGAARMAVLKDGALVQAQPAAEVTIVVMEAEAQADDQRIAADRIHHHHHRPYQLQHRQHQAVATMADGAQADEAAEMDDSNS